MRRAGPSLRPLFLLALLWWAGLTAAVAQEFPALSGRVVDAANIISPAVEAELTASLVTLEAQSQRQLVVATVPDLGGNDVADYGYRLGRHWGIGDETRNDGVILLIAPNERRMHIAVGYGLEPVLTDALSATIIRNEITPAFRNGDFDGGIRAGTNAIIRQLQLPPEEAAAVAAAAAQSDATGEEPEWAAIIFWLIVFAFFFVLPMIRAMRSGKRYHNSGSGPIIIWGGGSDWGGGSSGGSSWGGGGGGFGGGFSGGGGSFGGGGASGGW